MNEASFIDSNPLSVWLSSGILLNVFNENANILLLIE